MKKIFSSFLLLVIIVFSAGSSFAQGDTMYVKGRHIYSAKGEKVVLRGVNEMYVWSNDKTGSWSLDEIAKTGANCVRMVWTADVNKSQLTQLIDRCVAKKMIAMPECHSATGDWSKLMTCIMFWKDPLIISAVQRNRKWCLVNIGNEVGDTKVTASMFKSAYSGAIDSLRKWGYTVPIVIDASSWGQNINILFETWNELINHDPLKNVIFSAHSYWSSSYNYTLVANESKNKNMPIIIGEGPSPTAYPNCLILDYKTGLNVLGQNEIGWLAWSWGLVSNSHCVPNFDLTTNGKFGAWETSHAKSLVYEHPYSLMQTAERPQSMYPDSVVKVSGMQIFTNKTTVVKGDSAKINVAIAPVNAANKTCRFKLIQTGDYPRLSNDSTHIIGLSAGSVKIEVLHPETGIISSVVLNIETPVSITNAVNQEELEVYPNPANDLLNVRIPGEKDVYSTISQLNGSVVERISCKGSFQVKLNRYQPGMYVISVSHEGETYHKTFIKQ